jgi:hypothetical protein
MWFCVEISQGGAFVSRSLRTREIRNWPTGKRKAKHPNGLKAGLNEAAKRLNDSKRQALPIEFETCVK